MINKKIKTFMYFLTKEAARNSFKEWLEEIDISDEDYKEISNWFKEKGIELFV